MAATRETIAGSDYEALTRGCALVDRSDRGKLALTGAGAVEFLNGQVTNDVTQLRPGGGLYAAFLTHKGKMLGDLRVLAVGDASGREEERRAGEVGAEEGAAAGPVAELLLDTERSALQALFDMIRRFKVGYDVELHKRTLECALLSLVGPRAHDVARLACDAAQPEPPAAEHEHVAVSIAGAPVRLIGTRGAGVDVLVAAPAAEAVRAALIAGGAQAVSQAAAEIVRVEAGIPRYGLDMDESTIPQEAGLNERAVSFTKGCYVGQETVARLYYKGKPNRILRGLELDGPAAVGAQLRHGERVVGALGSCVTSPRLGDIGLALVRREAEPGALLEVGDGASSAVVVELPFPHGD